MAGLLVGLLGATVAARWLFQVDAITRLIPGSEHMGIVTPLLFVAAGICLFDASQRSKAGSPGTELSTLCIAALIALPLALLLEAATGIELLRGVVSTADPHPSSPNANLGFLLAGLAFWLFKMPTARVRQVVVPVLVLAIGIIGLGGLVGHFVRLGTLYQEASFNRILPATAFGLSMIGAGLWMLHDHARVLGANALERSERRIRRRSIAVIMLVALAGGVAGFAVMRDTFERSISRNMLLMATTNATALAHSIDMSLWNSRTVATRLAVRETLEKLYRTPHDAPAKDLLQKIADSTLTADLTGIEFSAAEGGTLARSGSSVRTEAQATRHPLTASQPASLAWYDGYVLVTETEAVVDGRVVGRVLTEQSMPLFDRLLADIRASSEGSDAVICSRGHEKAICAPTRLRPMGFETPMVNAAGNPGLPVTQALRGEHGVRFFRDAREVNVVSAFTPIGDFGLGLAVKTDVEALYAPLRAPLNLLAVCLVGIIAMAIYALHSQVRPLLEKLAGSERRLKAILEDQSELVSLSKPDGELTYVNPAYARNFDETPAQMIGRNLFDYVAPSDLAYVQRVISDVLSTGKSSTDEHRTTAVGRPERWVAWTNSFQRDPSGQPMLHSVGRDVTERKRAELALRASQDLLTEKSALLEATLERMEQGIMMINAAGVVEVCNRRTIELLDLPSDLMASRPTLAAVLAGQHTGDESADRPADLQDLLGATDLSELPESHVCERPDGQAIEVQSVPIEGGGVLRTYTDVTERHRADEHIRHVARHDGLTSLVNREVFLEHLAGAVGASHRSGDAFAVHYIDLDGFKPINDRFGHAIGDKVLMMVASRMGQIARDVDVVARMGGDEFAVLQRHAERLDSALGLAERIIEGVGQTIDIEAHRLRVGASIGIAMFPVGGADPDTLVRHADAAMYVAKASGRNRVRVFGIDEQASAA